MSQMVIYLEKDIPLPDDAIEANSSTIMDAGYGVIGEMLDEYQAKMGKPFHVVSIDVSVNMDNKPPINVRIRGKL